MEWTSIDELWDTAKVGYDGGFNFVRRTKPHPGYADIVSYAKKPGLAPRLLKSESSRSIPSNSTSKGPKFDIFGSHPAESAHFLPHSPTCTPTWGIMGQAVVGVVFEARGKDAKTALQQLVAGKKDEDKVKSGLRYSPLNKIPLPPAHRGFFDDNPVLLLVPILTLKEVKDWKMGTAYWALCIVGDWGRVDGDDAVILYKAERYFHKLFGFGPEKCDGEAQKLSTEEDIDTATELLSHFVKANADVLMGREGNGNLLTPMDLFDDGNCSEEVQNKKKCLERTKDKLTGNGAKVTVPVVHTFEKDRTGVLKVKLTEKKNVPVIPDPALMACKAAVTWSDRCEGKLLLAWNDEPEPAIDPEESLLYEMAQEEYDEIYAESIRPPADLSELAAALSGSSAAVVNPEKDGPTGDK